MRVAFLGPEGTYTQEALFAGAGTECSSRYRCRRSTTA